MSLVSPGTQVSVTDQSFYIPAIASTVPLFFIATRTNKYQPNGVDIADGTNESNVVRTVTSIGESVKLYGVPFFNYDNSGPGNTRVEYHGDARNEYGLFALNQFLSIGNMAYVVRANIDLTDAPKSFISASIPVLDSATLEYIGVGNGTLTGIAVSSQLKEPEKFTLVAIGAQQNSTDMSFSVTGSISGTIGVATVGTPFVNSSIEFTINAGTIDFQPGDYFEFYTVYEPTTFVGTGNGTMVNLVPGTNAIEEDFTIEFTSATDFIVTGVDPVLGTITTPPIAGTIGATTPFDDGVLDKLSFIILPGSTPFVAGDTFTVELREIQVFNQLGVSDADKRLAIVTALQAAINSNEEVRSESYEFNLIICPGYPELVDEMTNLSDSIDNEAFVIADTYCYHSPERVVNWASGQDSSAPASRKYHTDLAYYYPWGLASNLDGNNVLVAPSGIALKTYAYSDKASELWFAPAGLRRGLVSGIESFGYVTGTLGLPTTYIKTNLNKGQRDALYQRTSNINPLVSFPTRGMVIWGQKTSVPSSLTSARDRINVERLICYIRRQLRISSYSFLFEPNDQITRDDFKAMVDNFLGDLMMRRALYDFVTLCDESNNTPARIDRNELWCDIALKPVKAIEFIYIPIRILSTGAKMGTN